MTRRHVAARDLARCSRRQELCLAFLKRITSEGGAVYVRSYEDYGCIGSPGVVQALVQRFCRGLQKLLLRGASISMLQLAELLQSGLPLKSIVLADTMPVFVTKVDHVLWEYNCPYGPY